MITTPQDNSYFVVGEKINCTAKAYCQACGEISEDIIWTAVEELAEDGEHQFPGGEGPTYSITPPGPGKVYIQAFIKCDDGTDIDWIYVTVFEVEIISPVTPPPTANNFVFSSANPGVCNVPCEAEARPSEYTDDIEPWSIDAIRGSVLTTVPSPPKGGIVTFTFTGLPVSNGEFGDKDVTAELTLGGKTDKDTEVVQIFFPRDATNNPGGNVPNGYYYWSQFHSASTIMEYIDATTYYGEYIVNPSTGRDRIRIYRLHDILNFTNNETTHTGIHCYIEIITHEDKHREIWRNWWPNGVWNPGLDIDNDYVPDEWERIEGATYGFIVGVKDDSDALYEDALCRQAEHDVNETHHDKEDWAYPGKQSQN
jgi:hypothetical protein